MKSTPIIIFAKTTLDRDYLRSVLKEWNESLLYFENESICFDNLLSIDPKAIVIKTDSSGLVWRFVFALHIIGVDSPLFILSDILDAGLFNLEGLAVSVCCHSPKHVDRGIDAFRHLISQSPSADKVNNKALLAGEASAITNINSALPSLKRTLDPVLITGEPGTGKELLARLIANHPGDESVFIKFDCANFKTDRVDLNRSGEMQCLDPYDYRRIAGENVPGRINILFDKINQLNENRQSEFLLLVDKGFRFFSKHSFEASPAFRFIATSDVDMAQMVKRNRFRKDLFYRLNVIPVHLPPLRQRKEDIPLLTDYLAIQACARMQRSFIFPSHQVMQRLSTYQWPGNVDELKRAIDRFVVSGNEEKILTHTRLIGSNANKRSFQIQALDMETIPDPWEIQNCLSVVGNISLKSICERFACRAEKMMLQKALETTNWNRKKAAALLSISYKSMLNKMKMYEIV